MSALFHSYLCGRKATEWLIAMKETNVTQIKICPRCGKAYYEPAAISRMDNQTLICPDCGTREALESIDVDRTEQEEILEIIHRQRRRLDL